MKIKKIQNICFIVLTMIMLLMMVTSSCAAETTPAGKGDNTVTVTYVVAEGFTLVIPTAVTLGEVGQEIPVSDIHASNVVIDNGKFLTVKVYSPNGWNVHLTGNIVQHHETDKISYVMNYRDVSTGSLTNTSADGVSEDVAVTVFKHAAGSGSGSASLSFTRTGAAQKAGTFEDQLIFRVSVED